MKLVYVCYAALGYAVARWIFQRQACSGHGSGYALPFLWPAVRACDLGRAAPRCVPFESRTPALPSGFVGTVRPEVLRLTFVPALSFPPRLLSTISSGQIPPSYQLNAGRAGRSAQ